MWSRCLEGADIEDVLVSIGGNRAPYLPAWVFPSATTSLFMGIVFC
jgi:hypothetical protein